MFDKANLNRLLDSHFREKKYGYSILITKDFKFGTPENREKTLYSKTGGYSNLELLYREKPSPPHPPEPPNPDKRELANPIHSKTKFQIGSITKQFTAIAILILYENGLLDLSDPIQKWFPNFPIHSLSRKKITIRHLLTHTSGLLDTYYFSTLLYPRTIYPKYARQFLFLDSLKDYPVYYEPGTIYIYSNFGYILLGLIIEIVSKKSYKDYMQMELFDKIGMGDTTIDDQNKIIDNRAQGYRMSDSGLINAPNDSSRAFSAGSITSTPEDLNKFYKALFNSEIISKDLLEEAHTSYTLQNGKKTGYGYGWIVDNSLGVDKKTIAHSGQISGFTSSVYFQPFSKTLVVLLSNFLYPTTCISINDLKYKSTIIDTLALSMIYYTIGIINQPPEIKILSDSECDLSSGKALRGVDFKPIKGLINFNNDMGEFIPMSEAVKMNSNKPSK